jgi:hypothetical protein
MLYLVLYTIFDSYFHSIRQERYCPHCLNTKPLNSVCGISEQGADYDLWLDSTGNPMPWNSNGNIYIEGNIITIDTFLRSHHTGHMTLSVCNLGRECKQDDFDENPLIFISDDLYGMPGDENNPYRGYYFGSPNFSEKPFSSRWLLPENFHGENVLMQWTYITANSCSPDGYVEYYSNVDFPIEYQTFWNADLPTCTSEQFPPTYKTGDSPERFVNCAEITILAKDGNDTGDENNNLREECEDDTTFGFGGDSTKDCEWVKSKKKRQRCYKTQPNSDGKKVNYFCPSVCDKKCAPCKDSTKKKKIRIDGTKRKCKYIAENNLCGEKSDNGKSLSKKCKLSCSKCPVLV